MYPEQSQIIEMDEPLGEVANNVRDREIEARRKLEGVIDEEEINEIAMRTCISIVRYKLEEVTGDMPLAGPDGIKRLLVKQRHLHKKGIMFTTFVFAMVIADLLGIEILWSSDCEYSKAPSPRPAWALNSIEIGDWLHRVRNFWTSGTSGSHILWKYTDVNYAADTIVLEDSLEGTINAIAGDPRAGGSSSGLVVHNAEDNVVTKLASCVYWCELYLTRSMPASMAASDCQSGPSAAFRLSAIRPILIQWYNQKIFGKRMVCSSCAV